MSMDIIDRPPRENWTMLPKIDFNKILNFLIVPNPTPMEPKYIAHFNKDFDAGPYYTIMPINENWEIVINSLGQTFAYVHPKQPSESIQKDSPLPCQPYCGHKMRRTRGFHISPLTHIREIILRGFRFTCLFCRIRRVHSKQLPGLYRIDAFYVFRRRGRRLELFRNLLGRKVMTVLEFLYA